jgi:mediator of RNA polymerase II transcription subunit 31
MELEEDPERTRFLVELEFVQCLANPHYLRWLATEGYLRDEKFIRYLDYLQYWKKPEYAKFIIYPHCLRFLDLLQHEEIRVHLIENSRYSLEIADQQFYHWLYRRKQAQLPADAKASQDGSSAADVSEEKVAQANAQ